MLHILHSILFEKLSKSFVKKYHFTQAVTMDTFDVAVVVPRKESQFDESFVMILASLKDI